MMTPQWPPNSNIHDGADEPQLEYAIKGTTNQLTATQARLREAEGLLREVISKPLYNSGWVDKLVKINRFLGAPPGGVIPGTLYNKKEPSK